MTPLSDRDQLVLDHVALVNHLVREVSARLPQSVDRDDLRSAGLAALVAASQGYDAERGVPFTPYAAARVRGALLDELRSADWASRSVRRRGRQVAEVRRRLANTEGAVVDDRTVAAALGVTPGEVARADADVARATVLPLDAEEQHLEAMLPSSGPCPAELVERAEHLEFLADAIVELPERLRAVVTGCYLQARTTADVGAELGVTGSRVGQLRGEALVLLREAHEVAYAGGPVEPAERLGVAAGRRRRYAEAVADRHAARRTARRAVPTSV